MQNVSHMHWHTHVYIYISTRGQTETCVDNLGPFPSGLEEDSLNTLCLTVGLPGKSKPFEFRSVPWVMLPNIQHEPQVSPIQ